MGDDQKDKLAALKRALAGGDIARASDLLNIPQNDDPPVGVELSGDTAAVRDVLARTFGARPLETPRGICMHLQPDVAGIRPGAPGIIEQFDNVMRGARQHFDELGASPGVCLASDIRAGDILLLSLMSTGGADVHICLAATMTIHEADAQADVYLAPDRSDEPAVVAALSQRLAGCELAVVFDTRPASLPLFRKRAEACKVTPPDRLPRTLNLRADLRKRFAGQLRSYSLNALEQVCCQYRRPDRVDRRAAGRICEHLIHTGQTGPLRRLVECISQDLLTMVQLTTVLLTGAEPYID